MGTGETEASEFCTGNFKEKNPNDAGNRKQRPDAGTPCAGECQSMRGRWGENYCWTKDGNWGALCLRCDDLCETGENCDLDGGWYCNKNAGAKKGVCEEA